MGIEFTKQIIKNVEATTSKEVLELLGFGFYVYLFISLLIIALINIYMNKKQENINLKYYMLIFIAHIIVYFSLTKIDYDRYVIIIKYDVAKVVPIGPIKAFSNYLRTYAREQTVDKKDLSKYFSLKKQDVSPVVAVLIIGESARADRFSLNGYERETNPNLSKVKNVTSFSNASSCDTSTQSSVPCLLVRDTFDSFHFPIHETSIIDIFRKHGFKTYWISIQSESTSIKTLANEAEYVMDRNSKQYDMDLLKDFNDIINNTNENTLIVIHTVGSHFDYNTRVPDKDKIFKPLCNKSFHSCKKRNLDNSYDNTIYYTDIFLSSIIKKIKHKNAFVFYTSDHGESLGEKYAGFVRRFGHASPYNLAPKEQTNVPFIVWFSSTYLEKHPLNLDPQKKVSHDYIFNSMLGCAGFDSEQYLDEKLNICKE
jgi:glucan phosphoethanolaminetransferase (alkaline phosphatase superfamily)